MKISGESECDDVTRELSLRFKQYRILYPMTQSELADRSMVSVSTIKRFENGEDISLSKLIRIMKSLDLLGNTDVLVPDLGDRPSRYLDDYKPRQRAGRKRGKTSEWHTGAEE